MGPTRRSPPGWPHGAGPIARRLPHGGVKLWGCVKGGFWRIGGLPHRGPILWGEAAPWGRPHTGGHAQRGGPAHRKAPPHVHHSHGHAHTSGHAHPDGHAPIGHAPLQTTPTSRVPAPHRKPRLQTGPRPQKRPRPSPSTPSASHDVSATLIGSPRSDEVGGRVRPSCRTLIG